MFGTCGAALTLKTKIFRVPTRVATSMHDRAHTRPESSRIGGCVNSRRGKKHIADSSPSLQYGWPVLLARGDEMELVEYLYVDAKRLDTYFEQISSPVTYDKVPVWEASLTITSPGAKGSQQRFARPFTTHEKISKLTEHLEDKGLVGYGRATAQTRGTMFRIETCRAKRVFIPPDHGQPPEVGALNVWISAVPRTPEEIEAAFEGRKVPGERGRESPGNLYLLENYKHSDVNGFDYMSSYSALSLMIGDLPIPGSGNNHSGRNTSTTLLALIPLAIIDVRHLSAGGSMPTPLLDCSLDWRQSWCSRSSRTSMTRFLKGS